MYGEAGLEPAASRPLYHSCIIGLAVCGTASEAFVDPLPLVKDNADRRHPPTPRVRVGICTPHGRIPQDLSGFNAYLASDQHLMSLPGWKWQPTSLSASIRSAPMGTHLPCLIHLASTYSASAPPCQTQGNYPYPFAKANRGSIQDLS